MRAALLPTITWIVTWALAAEAGLKVVPPQAGAYHGAYADFGPTEDDVTEEKIQRFIETSGKKIAWAYFSNHWSDAKIVLPKKNLEACRSLNVVPYIRMSPWSEMKQSRPDARISMQKIIDGKFDRDLQAWAREARDHRGPIMIEFGPEVNGHWFPWNGKWNGGAESHRYGDPLTPDGPERFRDAYRHVIDLFRAEGANNITWVLHVDAAWSPQADWNRVAHYYPGDQYIDWIGVSVFGRQLPKNDWLIFPAVLKGFLAQIEEATSTKPILISEFGVIEDGADPNRKAQWLRQALQSVSKGLFKRVKGVTYWNSPGWLPSGRASFLIDSSTAALDTYRTEISSPFWVDTAVIGDNSDRHWSFW